MYFSVTVGPNITKTETIKNAEKEFTQDWNMNLLAEARENKINVILWDYNTITANQIYGIGQIPLPVASGEKKIVLYKEDKEIGILALDLTAEKVTSCKTITLSDIKVKLLKSGDILGSSDPYIVAKIGGWSGRTETGQG